MKHRWSGFWETHKQGMRLLRIAHRLDRNQVPVTLLYGILAAAIPYITLILSARVVDMLLSKRYQEALWLALLMVGLVFLGELLGAVADKVLFVGRNMLQEQLKILIRKKGMELDYTTMNDPDVLKVISDAEFACRFKGGLGTLVRNYRILLTHLLTLVTAVVLTISLCAKAPVKSGSVLGVLAHPAVTASCLILAWLFGTFVTRGQVAKVKKLEEEIAQKHSDSERRFAYWYESVYSSTESGKTIRVNGMWDFIMNIFTAWESDNDTVYKDMGRSQAMKIRAEGLESGGFSVAAYLLVLAKVLTKAISVGSFAQYAGALLQFNQAKGKLLWSESEVTVLVRLLTPMADFLDRENDMAKGSIHIEKRNDNVYELEFHDVGFRYPGSEDFTLRHVSGKLSLKKKMAVVGPNGAGKTTFIKLLCRLYDPTEGYITLNGIDIRKYDYMEYLKLFGVVFQDFHLFGASVKENVAARGKFEESRVISCLRQAGVLDFVESLPQGADTIIERGDEEGIDLSGGQSQKISIARALYKDAPFVILDEPTAALDPLSEAEIYERFHEMVADKTSVYISHRMSSCRFCDEILVFHKGTVVERGGHEELLKKGGLYQKLWSAQAQYYA